MIPLYIPARKNFIKDISHPTIGDAIQTSKKSKKITIPVKQRAAVSRLAVNSKGKLIRLPARYSRHHYSLRKPIVPKHSFIAALPWLPRKYTASKGLVTDWHARTFRELKLVVPVVLAMTGLFLLSLSWQLPDIGNYGAGHLRYISETSNDKSQPSQDSQAPNNTPQPTNTYTAPPSTQVQAPTSPAEPVSSGTPVSLPGDITLPPVDVIPDPTDGTSDPGLPPITIEIPPLIGISTDPLQADVLPSN